MKSIEGAPAALPIEDNLEGPGGGDIATPLITSVISNGRLLYRQLFSRPDLGVAVLLLVIVVAARAQTFGNPVLGYDEQFYLLVGDRMIHGAIPFVDIFDRKPIGLFLIYAFIRLLGGEGTIEYQAVAALVVWATAFLLWRSGRRLSGTAAGFAAAIAYVLWLDFMEGEGGQAPVFFNLPMLAAAMLTELAIRRERVGLSAGALPMLIVGIAMQIKYTALFEGIFLGCALLWSLAKTEPRRLRVLWIGCCWIAAALAPTLAAYLVYTALGQTYAFVFANFLSMWGRFPDPLPTSIWGIVTILGVFAPLFTCAALAPTPACEETRLSLRFYRQWLVAALVGLVAMRSFSTPQYAMPVLAPAILTAAPWVGQNVGRRRFTWGALMTAFVASQFVLSSLQNLKGRAQEAQLVARAASPLKGCLFVYDGYPALYRLTNSCLLSPYVFPGHLNMANEASSRALGVDPTQEVARIMSLKPETVVLDDPPFERVNRQTYKLVKAELARHYARVFSLRTGDRERLVYRRRVTAKPAQGQTPLKAKVA